MSKEMNHFEIEVFEKPEITCSDVEKLYMEYYEGEMQPLLAQRIGCHVAKCSSCREFADSYDDVVQLAPELKDSPLAEDIRIRLRESLKERLGVSISL